MTGAQYLTLAALIVLLLPVAVMALEGRRAPDLLYALVATAGLASSAWYGGWSGLGSALASGLIVLILIGGAITALRGRLRLRLLTGGQIKLMAAGATWFAPLGALLMVGIGAVGMITIAIWQHMREKHTRPDSAIVLIVAIMIVAVKQYAVSP